MMDFITDKNDVEQIIALHDRIRKNHEFEVMFFAKNRMSHDDMTTVKSFMNEYDDKVKVEYTLDIVHSVSAEAPSHRITINGMDDINKIERADFRHQIKVWNSSGMSDP